jgi:hypothetical protein
VGPFEIVGCSFPNEGYDPVALFQNMWNPPVKGWLTVYAKGHGILGSLQGMRFFKVRKVLPGG